MKSMNAPFLAALCLSLVLPTRPARGEVKPADRELVQSVFTRLLAVVDPRPSGLVWPPTVQIEDRDTIIDARAFRDQGDRSKSVSPRGS